MAANGINLGTVFGTVRLRFNELQNDIAQTRNLLTAFRDELTALFAESNPLQPLEDAMAALPAVVTPAADEAATALTEANSEIEASAADAAAAVAAAADEIAGSAADMAASGEEAASGWSAAFGGIQERMGGFAASMGGAFATVQGAGARMGEGIGGLGERLAFLGAGFHATLGHATSFVTGMLEFEALAGATSAVGKFAGSLIGMNTEFEQLHAQLTSITGSGGEADRILAWVKQFGQQVPDTTEHLAQAVVTIQSLGLNATQIMPSLANVAAAMGVDLPTASRAFADAFMGRWRMMQFDLHVTKEQMQEFGLQIGKNGQVVQSTFIPAFEKLAQVKFGHGIQNQMQTLGGQLSNLTDRVQFFAMAMGKPLFDQAKQTLSGLFSWLDSHKAQVDAFAKTVGTGLGDAFKTVGSVISGIPGFLSQIEAHFGKAFGSAQGGKVNGLKDALSGIGSIIGTVAGFITSNFLPTVLTMADVIGTVAGKVSATIAFFQQHQAALNALLAVLGAVLAVLGATAIYVLIGLVPAFVAWAGAAAIAAVATIAAALPVIAIGAAIAALIFIIVEIVQHWGDITKAVTSFTSAAWSAISGFFGRIGSAIVGWALSIAGWFAGLFSGAKKSVDNKLADIHTGISGFFDRVKTLVTDGLGTIGDFIGRAFMSWVGLVTLPFRLIVDLFKWLFDHNYYFHNLVVSIQTAFKIARAFVIDLWTGLVGWLGGVWHGIVTLAHLVWGLVVAAISNEIRGVERIVTGVIATIQHWLADAWAFILKVVQTDWALFVKYIVDPLLQVWATIQDYATRIWKFLQNAWDTVVTQVHRLWDRFLVAVKLGVQVVLDWVNAHFLGPIADMLNLGEKAFQWGANLLKAFGNGLASMAGYIKDKALGALGGLAKVLGFHSPAEEGPGKDADTWSPNLMRMYARGITRGTPDVVAAASDAMTKLRAGMTGGLGHAPLSAAHAGHAVQVHGDYQPMHIDVHVTVSPDEADGPPELVGNQLGAHFGANLATALDLTLAQRGHK